MIMPCEMRRVWSVLLAISWPIR